MTSKRAGAGRSAVSLLVGLAAWMGAAAWAQTPPTSAPPAAQAQEQAPAKPAAEAAGLPKPVESRTLTPAPQTARPLSPPPRYSPPTTAAAPSGAAPSSAQVQLSPPPRYTPPAGSTAAPASTPPTTAAAAPPPAASGAPASTTALSQMPPGPGASVTAAAQGAAPAAAAPRPVAAAPAQTGTVQGAAQPTQPQAGPPASTQAAPAGAPAPTPVLAQDRNSAGVERVAAPAEDLGYVLGPNDRLRLIVFGEENLSGEFAVDSTGRIALPLVGEVIAAGLDVRSFERAIEQRLADGYLRDPRVSVEVLTARPFYILGEVQKPGQYPFIPGMTAPNAVATAGGFAPLADQGRVFIKRSSSVDEQELPLSPTTLVQPGDTIRIAKGAFYILGEVNQAGEYPFTDNMTVMQAVATAKGFTYRANRGRVFIRRAGEPDERSYKLTPTLRLQPGDTIRIGERFF